jgi:phosphomannomutase
LEPFCPDEKKFAIVDGLRSQLSKKYDTIEIDGVRVKFDEESWFLIRASNTGPRLTLRFEADTKDKVRKMVEIAAVVLKKYPEVSKTWVEEARENVRYD